LLGDRLNADDWYVIARYIAILRLYKEVIIVLQGNISTTSRYRVVKGAIWQVLPVYEAIMTYFKFARGENQPLESQSSNQTLRDTSEPTLL
jgi:hypothetical protein